MKLGLLASFYPEVLGGAEASLDVLLGGYRRAEMNHVLFTLSGATPISADTVQVPHFQHVPRKLKIGGLSILDLLLGRQLPPLIRRHGVDLLHVQDTYSICGGVKGAEAAKVPVVLTCMNNIGVPYESFGVCFPVSSWLNARDINVLKAVRKCSLVVAISNYVARQLITAGVPAPRVKTIYTAGTMAAYSLNPWPRDHETLHVLAIGRLYYYKGFQNLLLATKQLVTEGKDIRVMIVGRGPYARNLSQLARDLKLGDHIHFQGFVPNSRTWSAYEWSDAVVVPTITPEPFGRVVVEAMSRGRPVIGTNVGGIPEIISDGETGYLVAPGCPQAIAERLRVLEEQRDLIERMGRAAISKCRERFDRDVITQQLKAAYESVGNLAG